MDFETARLFEGGGVYVVDAHSEKLVVSVAENSHDALVAANVWLSMLQDMCKDGYTRMNIQMTIKELSDMLYGHNGESEK